MESLLHLSASELRNGYRHGNFKVIDVAEAYINHDTKLNPKTNAFLHLDPEAIRAGARELDSRKADFHNHALYGVPVAVKDNISTKGIPTTCGSKILEGYRPLFDATAVAGLKKHGALILGKTNMDEFAMGSSTENSAYGTVRNPWDPDRVPGGSSGGSAAAVAACMAPIALGSDTGGSIRQPAALTGILGLKCTYGLVSRFGLVAYASSLDQIGPMARNVDDLAIALEAIASFDRSDSTSHYDPQGCSYLAEMTGTVEGLKIGLPKELFGEGIDPAVRESVTNAAKVLEGLGARIRECSLPQLSNSLPAYYIIAPAEASSNLARFDGVRYGPGKPGKDIIEQYSGTRGSRFGPEVQRRILIGTFVLSSGYYDAYYLKAMQIRRLLSNQLDEAFQNFDLLLTPTTPQTAFRIGEKAHDPLAMYLSDICTIAVNLAGIPAISIPCGLVGGLPSGFQLWGPHFSERRLLSAARCYLDKTGHHRELSPMAKEAK